MSTIEHDITDFENNADVPPHPGRRMTEDEFVAWCGDFWAEWVDGEVVMMMTVHRDHAFLQDFLQRLVGTFVEERRLGRTLTEPFHVRLGAQRRRRSPDIFFVSNDRLHLVHEHELEGGPDLAIEIVSPDSEARDWREKYHEYEAAGVREYWVVNPTSARIEAYVLTQDRYAPIPVTDGKINSVVLPGFHIRPEWIRPPYPRILEALKDMGL